MAAAPEAKKPRKGITWDEPTIAEHDKERGTRMKIDEPDTPFYADESASDAEGEKHGGRQDVHVTAAQWAQDAAEEGDDDELEALGCGAADAESEGPEDGGGTHAGGPVDVQHVKEFSKARSAHYDEWQAVLAARAKAAEEDDEEETAVAAGH